MPKGSGLFILSVFGWILRALHWPFSGTIARAIVMTFLCYFRVIVFDNTTLSGAMISGLVLSTSFLSIIRLLKAAYNAAYSITVEEKTS